MPLGAYVVADVGGEVSLGVTVFARIGPLESPPEIAALMTFAPVTVGITLATTLIAMNIRPVYVGVYDEPAPTPVM